jgi:hypothetical protein
MEKIAGGNGYPSSFQRFSPHSTKGLSFNQKGPKNIIKTAKDMK